MKTIQIIRLVFALIFGFALMAYAGYAWHVEWINDWQALIVGTIGCAFAFVPHIIIKYLGKAIPKLFELTIGRFFNKPPKAGMLILFVLCSFAASAQYHNVKGVRVVHDNDSTIISGVGQIRYDQATGKFRFGNGASWFSFRRDDVPIAAGDMVLADVQTSTGKKTFQANGTSAGINISSVTSDPSTLVNADMWYNSFQGSPKIHISGTNRHLAYTTSQIANGVGYFAVSNNAQLQTDAQFNYVQAPTKILTVGTGGTSQIKTGNILFNAQTTNPSSPVNGQLWYNSTDGKLRGYQGGAVIDLGGSSYTAAQGLTLSGTEFRLGGTLTGGTLSQITSTSGNGLYVSMGSGVGTSTGSWQISPVFSVMRHQVGGGDLVEYIQQSGVGEFTGKHRLVTVPVNDDTETQILVRDATTGDIEYRTAASLAPTEGSCNPVFTCVSNCDGTGSSNAHYIRVDDKVTITGTLTIDATAASTLTVVEASFCVGSNFSSVNDAHGVVTSIGVGYGIANPDTTNDVIEIHVMPTTTTSQTYKYQITYLVKP